MIGLSLRQRQLLRFIESALATNGTVPTFDEMAAGLRLKSRGNIANIITALVVKGALRRTAGKHRSIEIVESKSVTLNSEILTLTDRYAAEHKISRDTAANELIRSALEAA